MIKKKDLRRINRKTKRNDTLRGKRTRRFILDENKGVGKEKEKNYSKFKFQFKCFHLEF